MKVLLECLEILNEKIADTILQQMGGGRRLKAFIGARDFYSDNGGRTLVFRFPNPKRSKPNMVRVTLNGKDLYDMELGRAGVKREKVDDPDLSAQFKKLGIKPPGKSVYKKIKEYNDIYADQLVGIFEKATGLYLRL